MRTPVTLLNFIKETGNTSLLSDALEMGMMVNNTELAGLFLLAVEKNDLALQIQLLENMQDGVLESKELLDCLSNIEEIDIISNNNIDKLCRLLDRKIKVSSNMVDNKLISAVYKIIQEGQGGSGDRLSKVEEEIFRTLKFGHSRFEDKEFTQNEKLIRNLINKMINNFENQQSKDSLQKIWYGNNIIKEDLGFITKVLEASELPRRQPLKQEEAKWSDLSLPTGPFGDSLGSFSNTRSINPKGASR